MKETQRQKPKEEKVGIIKRSIAVICMLAPVTLTSNIPEEKKAITVRNKIEM